MAIGPLKKIAAKRASEICAQLELSADAQKLLNDRLSPDAYLDLLVEKEQWVDAIRLLAFARGGLVGGWLRARPPACGFAAQGPRGPEKRRGLGVQADRGESLGGQGGRREGGL